MQFGEGRHKTDAGFLKGNRVRIPDSPAAVFSEESPAPSKKGKATDKTHPNSLSGRRRKDGISPKTCRKVPAQTEARITDILRG